MTSPAAPDSLYGMAAELMVRLKTCMTSRGLPIPARQVLYMAPIPADCEQIAVLVSGWVPQPPWDGGAVCVPTRWFGSFSVVITRDCAAVPGRSGKTPSADAMTATLRTASDDADALTDLVASLSEVGPELVLETPAPDGGLQSVVMLIQVPAAGF